jgi:hypothetical protein
MQAAERLLRRADRQHQRRAWVAFPYAVIKKFGDDQAGNLAALIAYFGFLSLFPLMLVLVTLLGMLLHNNPELQDAIQASALANSRSSERRSRTTSTHCVGAFSPWASGLPLHSGPGSEW